MSLVPVILVLLFIFIGGVFLLMSNYNKIKDDAINKINSIVANANRNKNRNVNTINNLPTMYP